MSPFLPTGVLHELPNTIAGIMAFYLVLTSWVAIRRKDGGIGRVEKAGLAVALTVFIAGVSFILAAMNSPTGTIGDTPPQAFYVLRIGGRHRRRVGPQGDPQRRHFRSRAHRAPSLAHVHRVDHRHGLVLPRQQKFLPQSLHGSPLLFIPVFAPLLVMAFWLVRIRFGRRFARPDGSRLAVTWQAKAGLAPRFALGAPEPVNCAPICGGDQ